MSRVISISRDEQRLDAACRWILKLDNGSLADPELLALSAWLDEQSENLDVLLEVASLWDKTDTLSRLADLFPHSSGSFQEPPRAQTLWGAGSAVAAGIGVFVIGFTILLTVLNIEENTNIPQQAAVYETAVGERKTVLLPDGSEIVLNTNSQLSLAFTSSARILNLSRGEILVRVAKEDRPLSVVANDQIVQAKGTAFSVEITEEQYVNVMVTEGKVVVGIQSPDSTEDFPVPPELEILAHNALSAGEELILGHPEAEKKSVTPEEIKVKLSWNEGRLIFRSEPLERVLREVERYTSVEFIMLDERLKSKVLTGHFRTGDVETLLDLLESNFNINYQYEGKDLIVLTSL